MQHALDLIDSGHFSHGDRQLFAPLTGRLRHADPYLVCADYRAYLDCQGEVDAQSRDREQWTRKSIFNVARVGHFSSDRAIREYASEIWRVGRVAVRG